MQPLDSDARLYVRFRGKVSGPFSLPELRQLRERGQLNRFHEVSADQQRWLLAGELEGLIPARPAAARGSAAAASPAVEKWYFAIDDQLQGPVTRDQLMDMARDDVLGDDPLVWKEGMPSWQPLASTDLVAAAASPAGQQFSARNFGRQGGAVALVGGVGLVLVAVGFLIAAAAEESGLLAGSSVLFFGLGLALTIAGAILLRR